MADTENPQPAQAAEALERLGGLSLRELSMEDLLQTVAELAQSVMPGNPEASVTLLVKDSPTTVVSTGQLAVGLDETQYERGHGPCLHAARTGELTEIVDTRTDGRWPDYQPRAVQHGNLSSLSVPLVIDQDEQVSGALNIYARQANAFDEGSRSVATRFGPHAAVAAGKLYAYRSGGWAVTTALRALLRASHLLPADDLGAAVAAAARRMGVRATVLYLADYEQARLLPLHASGVPERQELPIEGTMAGRAFRRVEPVSSTATAGTYRLWMPLLDGVERLGVAELELPTAPGPELERDLRDFVTLVAELLVVRDAYSDVFSRLRRRKTLSLAAEMQWELLPPMSFGTDRLVITGGLEPAYDIGGDSFDYAVNGSTADLLVLDAVGHGLPATVLASVAIGAYRHARRNAADLPDIAAEINTAIAGQFPGSQFATAVLARLDVDTGRLRWINAGHPEPLIVRGASLVRPPRCPPARPLGLQDTKPVCCEMRLEPGDRLVLYTDGITEARSPDGEFFGEQRLTDFISAAVAAGEPAPETVRQLMRHVLTHQADQLQDDASMVILEWRTGDEARLQL